MNVPNVKVTQYTVNFDVRIAGRIHSLGTIRGYCIFLDDRRRGQVFKRRKSLRVITDYVVRERKGRAYKFTAVAIEALAKVVID